LWPSEIAHSYAPSLAVRGVLAFAPAARFTTIATAYARRPFSAYLGAALWTIDGLEAAGYTRLLHPSILMTDQMATRIVAAISTRAVPASPARVPIHGRCLCRQAEQQAGQRALAAAANHGVGNASTGVDELRATADCLRCQCATDLSRGSGPCSRK
jgi:hypothetical protein